MSSVNCVHSLFSQIPATKCLKSRHWFQRYRPTRGRTVRHQTTPANLITFILRVVTLKRRTEFARGLISIYYKLVRNASPRGPMCFRCLIFTVSRPCELLFILCFIATWTWEVVSVMLYPCMLCVVCCSVHVSVCFVLHV